MDKNSRIYVAGHRGLVGSAILRKLKEESYTNLFYKTSKDFDLRNQWEASNLMEVIKPDYVFISAAKVGGIQANDTQSGDFFYDNIMIQTNLIHEAHKMGVKKLVFLGSSCIYPKLAPQPLRESYLMTSPLEPTNRAYATAKIAGIEMCKSYRKQYGDNFISVMPTNLYGPNDNFSVNDSHVLPGMIRKFHEAKKEGKEQVELWGSGTPRREFLHVDDLANGLLFLMENYNEPEHINIGVGDDLSIEELSQIIKKIVGYKGKIYWNEDYPDGTFRKLMEVTKIKSLGWKPKIGLKEGLDSTYQWFLNNYDNIRK